MNAKLILRANFDCLSWFAVNLKYDYLFSLRGGLMHVIMLESDINGVLPVMVKLFPIRKVHREV